jgi:hypothetical protein
MTRSRLSHVPHKARTIFLGVFVLAAALMLVACAQPRDHWAGVTRGVGVVVGEEPRR